MEAERPKMTIPKRTEDSISLHRIFLHHDNPRHEPYETQGEVIDYLCRNENVSQLARDIVTHGLNPLERFALFRDNAEESATEAAYIVGEGNRRICAIKLLTDPDLAPPNIRKSFERLANEWDEISEVPAVIFDDMDDLNLWLDRIHQGPQGGVGRKDWNADQKQRHSGSNKNRIALALLDYSEKKGFIAFEDRKRKLTTVQRYAGNAVFRETLGLDATKPDEVCRNRTPDDFDLLVRQFIADLLNRSDEVNSRSNSPQIEFYARNLGMIDGQSRERIEPEPIDRESRTKAKSGRRPRPGKHSRAKRLPYDAEIAAKLRTLKGLKLQNLYNSLCSIPLQEHTPLLAIGTWSFFETLTAKAGRGPSASFPSFFNKSRLQQYQLGKGLQTKPIREAFERISSYGNTTKHHDTAAAFNSDQLANDLETLRDLIVRCAEEAIGRGT